MNPLTSKREAADQRPVAINDRKLDDHAGESLHDLVVSRQREAERPLGSPEERVNHHVRRPRAGELQRHRSVQLHPPQPQGVGVDGRLGQDEQILGGERESRGLLPGGGAGKVLVDITHPLLATSDSPRDALGIPPKVSLAGLLEADDHALHVVTQFDASRLKGSLVVGSQWCPGATERDRPRL